MELDPQYTFVPLPSKNYIGLNDKRTLEFLEKWGLKGNISIQNFVFNEPFHLYHKFHIAESFFKDLNVGMHLLTRQRDSWEAQGITASTVEIKQIPCSVLSMSFFNKLKDPANEIVHASGNICKRYEEQIDGFSVSDNIRGMLLDEECPEYNVYALDERNEFVFRIFQMLVLGGELCQYEDTLQPYLDVTKSIYKDLIRVQKQKYTDDLSIETLVLEVIAKDPKGEAYYPFKPHNIQNVGFLLVDGFSREITTFLHQYGGCSYT